MADEAIAALARYFSGPCVALHSIGLGMSGPSRIAADAYYEARGALGVDGYATAEEAEAAIRRTLGREVG